MSTDVSKCNQVVFELLCKVAELIVSAKVCLRQQRRGTINSKVCRVREPCFYLCLLLYAPGHESDVYVSGWCFLAVLGIREKQ